MIKTILVPAIGNEADVASLAVALQIARTFAGHLDVLHVKGNAVEAAVAMAGDVGVSTRGALSESLIEELEREVGEREARAHWLFLSSAPARV
jgi:hypothetical protein